MNQKKRIYLALAILALLLSLLLPQGIRIASGYLSGRIQKSLSQENENGQKEENSNTLQEKDASEKKTVQEKEGERQAFLPESEKSPETSAEEKTSYETGLQTFLASFSPLYTESVSGGKEILLGGREEALSAALAAYLYSEYRDLVTITQVDVVALVAEDEAEITGLIQLFSRDGESERYLCTYNKTYDFYGIYPYTSSSNTISAYAPIGAGIPGRKLDLSIGIMKAYSSCVGEGPFTAELAMTEEEKDVLREHGHEYGAATGRPRRVGPFDVVASRYGVQCQGCDELALTLLDVLDYMQTIPVVEAYRLADGSTTDRFPTGKTLDDAQPVLKQMKGWHCDISGVRRYEDLPAETRAYVEYLEQAVGCRIKYISVGPERDACIVRD